MTTPTIAIATMMAAPTANTYVSVIGTIVSAITVGEGAGAWSTCMAVSVKELLYELEPGYDASIVYFPGISGSHT